MRVLVSGGGGGCGDGGGGGVVRVDQGGRLSGDLILHEETACSRERQGRELALESKTRKIEPYLLP